MNEDDIELGNYGRIARRSWWVLILGAIVGVLLAALLLPGQSTFFESRVSVLLVPGDSDLGQGADQINEDREIGIAISPIVGDRVVAQTEDIDFDEWSENLVISACLNSENIVVDDNCGNQILEFTYQGETAEQAESVVRLTAETYLSFRQDREQALRSETIANLEADFEGLDVRSETERAEFLVTEEDSLDADLIESSIRNLEAQKSEVVEQLTVLRSRSSEVGSLLGNPSAAEAGSSGIPFLFAVVAGAFLGLMLGAMAAIGLDRLDRRVAGADELENDLGVPILGDIPRITQDSPALVTAVSAHTPGAEAFRRVAAGALASRNGGMVNSIAIVGANENEGRTTTTINLALAMAQTGRDVLVVNTDRRNMVMDRIFGLAGEIGLNDYLRTDKDIEAAREAIESASRRVGIRVLSSGTGAEGPLSSSGLESLIAAAKERDMIVIFDTPPALTHAGGLQIAAIADSVLAVAASGRTRRSELAELRSQLDNVQAYLAGAVFNRTSRLSLLPAGQEEITAVSTVSTVSIPNGVPGNIANGSRNPLAPEGTAAEAAPEAQTEVASPEVTAAEVEEPVIEAPVVEEEAAVVETPEIEEEPEAEVFEPIAASEYETDKPEATEAVVAAASEVEVFEPVEAPVANASEVGVFPVVGDHAETNPNTNSVSSNDEADYVSSGQDFETPQSNGESREFVPAVPVTPSGVVTQPPPGDEKSDVEKFASMQGLFRQPPDGEVS